jgi:hypothetical protein
MTMDRSSLDQVFGPDPPSSDQLRLMREPGVRGYLAGQAWVQDSCAQANKVKRTRWRYPTVEHLVLALGVGGTVRERPAGIDLGPLGECFTTAQTLALAHPAYTYCEGWAYGPAGFPMHHAWLLDEAGQIIEVTWRTPGSEYLGVPFTHRFLLASMRRTRYWGIFYQDWAVMTADPATYVR